MRRFNKICKHFTNISNIVLMTRNSNILNDLFISENKNVKLLKIILLKLLAGRLCFCKTTCMPMLNMLFVFSFKYFLFQKNTFVWNRNFPRKNNAMKNEIQEGKKMKAYTFIFWNFSFYIENNYRSLCQSNR